MAFVIAQPCVGVKDTACVTVCPVDCIHPTAHEPEFEVAKQIFIHPDYCTDCSLCVAECPVNAIYSELDLPTEWADFVARNAVYYERRREP